MVFWVAACFFFFNCYSQH